MQSDKCVTPSQSSTNLMIVQCAEAIQQAIIYRPLTEYLPAMYESTHTVSPQRWQAPNVVQALIEGPLFIHAASGTIMKPCASADCLHVLSLQRWYRNPDHISGVS
jgi:hypothetical protein